MTVSDQAEHWPEQVGSKTEAIEDCGGVPGTADPTVSCGRGASQPRSVPSVG